MRFHGQVTAANSYDVPQTAELCSLKAAVSATHQTENPFRNARHSNLRGADFTGCQMSAVLLRGVRDFIPNITTVFLPDNISSNTGVVWRDRVPGRADGGVQG